MPEVPLTPGKVVLVRRDDVPPPRRKPAPFVELGVSSCFSFLRGASDAVEYAVAADAQGYDALGIADRNTLAGVVRMHLNLKGAGLRPVIGCRLVPADGPSFLGFPETRDGYGQLSALLSGGKMRNADGKWQDKDACHITLEGIAGLKDVILIVIPDEDTETFAATLPSIAERIPALSHVAVSYLYRSDDRARINRLDALARQHRLGILATNDVHYHEPARRPLQDVVTCIREKTTLRKAGYLLHANAERHLKSPEEMMRLFADWPHAIRASREIADRCRFSLDELKYEYPHEIYPEGRTAQQHLEALTWQGAAERYPEGVPDKIRGTLAHELRLIGKLAIARYFLTVHDIVAYARSLDPPILCQGRGSAANSAVCYCLGITAVDPTTTDLLFERFVSAERSEPPDIDVDFEHERREEVIQRIYEKYGRDRAGLCATVIHYRPRSAVREVGKVMGLSEDVTAALARTVWGSWGEEIDESQVAESGLDLRDPQLRRVIALTNQLIGKPRHLSQHVGGFILTERPLIETVPIGNGAMPERSFIEWDKDDIDALGILKIDVLALGMLTCIRKCFDLIAAHHGERFDLAGVPPEDPAVYDMLCRADSIGVFQVESRAQMNMLPRLAPREFYDLVIQVAIVRPGPIQGDMVHPYLKRRSGKEKVAYPAPTPGEGDPDELEKILKRTLGVPLFQEQAMKIAMNAAKFSPEEANQLRKSMATFRNRGTIAELEEKLVGRMVARGYEPDFAQRCFDQIKGFGEYGFPESHAASFALLVYISAWIKRHYPDAFACGLLNSQPMGFYAPAQIVRDAKEHGVEVRAPDVNYSDWDNLLEPAAEPGRYALRLGFRQVDGLHADAAARIVSARTRRYESIEELKRRSGANVTAIERLAAADAFRSMGLDRRQALWESRTLRRTPDLPLFSHAGASSEGGETPVVLPGMPISEHVVSDYQTLRLSLKAHPMEFLRGRLSAEGFTRAADLRALKSGKRVSVAGIVLIRQRPGSASGVVFVTMEDETGVANLVVWPDAFARFRRIVMGARLMAVTGTVQNDEGVIHVVAQRMEDRTADLSHLSDDAFKGEAPRGDHAGSWRPAASRHPRDVRVIPKSRDFH
jgi:error-prone DNA polymerase